MGAVALIALIAGGPLGVCLALAYGAVSVMKIAKVDAQYAKRGQPPPSARLIEKWLDTRVAGGARPAKVKPYGSMAYARQRWSAMWETLGDKHRADYAAEKRAREEAIAAGRPLPKKTTAKQRTLTGWRYVIDKIVAPVGEGKADQPNRATGGPVMTLADVMPAPGDAAAPVDGPRVACEHCGQTLTNKGGQWQHPSSIGCPNKPADYGTIPDHADENPPPADGPAPIGYGHPDYQPGHPDYPTFLDEITDDEITEDIAFNRATAHPLRQPTEPTTDEPTTDSPAAGEPMPPLTERAGEIDRYTTGLVALIKSGEHKQRPGESTADWKARLDATEADLHQQAGNPSTTTTSTEGDPMAQTTTTQMSGEVTGTRSAVVYARAMASAHAAHAGNEGYITSLANMEVGQGDISLVRAAMQASQNAAAAWSAAADSIERNNQRLREAYAQSPDAANKAANINE